MALLHFRPLGCPQGCPQGQHHSPHGTCLHAPASPGHSLSQTYACLPREKALRWGTCNIANVGWEGNSGSRTVSLTLLLTHIWLWVLHCATSVVSLQWGYTALCMPGETMMEDACLETFLRKASGAPTPPPRWQRFNLQRLLRELPACRQVYLLWGHRSPPAKRVQKGSCCSRRVCLPWPCVPWNAWQAFWDSIGSGGWL